jgi:hypothetical protein
MLTDILEYMVPPIDWSLENHLHDPNTNDSYAVLTPSGVWLPKNLALTGFDYNTFDENFVYQKLTELDWTAKNFKSFMGKGIPWCPRYFTEGQFNPPIVIADTSYRTVMNCAPDTKNPPANVGKGQTQLSGPYSTIDFGGDLGVQNCMIVTWQWDDGAVMETFYYAGPRTFGGVMWTTSNLVNGVYVIQKTSLFNQIVKGGFGALNFPCPIPS